VRDGKATRNMKVRLVRDGIQVYDGGLASLKRFKDDVREVEQGFECGLGLENFNDIKVGDIVEGYRTVETKRTLSER
jgi:translation initiation factor IF-2